MDFRGQRVAGGVRPATVNKQLREIRSALSYAVDANLLKANPLLRWRSLLLKEPDRVIRVVEPDEFKKLLGACGNPILRMALILGYHQGMRRGELVNLRWESVNLAGGVLGVVNLPEAEELTKSRRNRALPMHPDVVAALGQALQAAPKKIENGQAVPAWPYVLAWLDGGRIKRDWLTRHFDLLVKKAGIAHATLHDLRRSFSTIAQRAGVDKAIVQLLGGWSDVRVIERSYTGDLSGVMRAAMDKIARAEAV